jgi:DNA repair photolyase
MQLSRAKQLPLGFELPRRSLPTLDRRQRGVSFLGLDINRILNPPESTRMPFWSINPYIGCESGCAYCYARDTHRWAAERNEVTGGGRPSDEFERMIFIKRNAAEVIRRTLDPSRVGAVTIQIGTATDPYQPAERRFGLTRTILEALAAYRNLRIRITTKSPLVTRDVEVLTALSRRNRVSVSISLISVDPALIRRLEPKTPLPHARLRGLRTLVAAGVDAGLIIAPIIPGLTDGWGALGGLMAAGRDAGARYADGHALMLAPVARSGFLPVLEREFPELAARYRRRYGGRADPGREYLAALAARIRTLQRIHGFPVRESTAAGPARRPRVPSARAPVESTRSTEPLLALLP